MTISGADADALDALASDVEAAAHRLRRSQAKLGSAIHSSPWSGGNAERFRERWDSEYRRSMLAAAAFLDAAGEGLQRNADEQRDASSGDGGTGWYTRGHQPPEGIDPDIWARVVEIAELLGLGHRIGDLGLAGIGGAVAVAMRLRVNVSAYTRAGAEIAAHVRWRPGQADIMKRIYGPASHLDDLDGGLRWAGRGFAVAGGLLDGIDQWGDDAGRGFSGSEQFARAGTVAVTNAAVSYGVGVGTAAATGAVIGTFIPVPVVGTAVGFAVGAGVGYVTSQVLNSGPVRDFIADRGSDIHDGVSTAIETGGDVLDAGGDLLSGGANLVGRGVSALWP